MGEMDQGDKVDKKCHDPSVDDQNPLGALKIRGGLFRTAEAMKNRGPAWLLAGPRKVAGTTGFESAIIGEPGKIIIALIPIDSIITLWFGK